MVDHFDFLQWLDTDAGLKILTRLDDSADLSRASKVSYSWRHFVIANGLCKQLCLRIFPQLANVARISEIDVVSSNSMHDKEHKEHRVYASLFKALTAIKVIKISASRDTVVAETLIYKLRADFCLITEINIQPFQAYSSKSVRFRMGHKDLGQLPLQQHADEKFIWTYTSQDFPMSQENHLQNFKLSEPVLCIGGFFQIELLGRVQTQASVSHVHVLGRPLSPAFLFDNLGPSGEFDLKYSPKALLRMLKYSPEDLLRTLQNDSPPTHLDDEDNEFYRML